MGRRSFITYSRKLFVLVLLTLVFLEVGFRVEGFILSSVQALRNFLSAKQKNTYRILCLGESTTQGKYPFFLEKALNERNIGVRFSVIDKGLTGTFTSVIVGRVPSFLDEYHPDMVVAMMGINDWGKHMPLEAVDGWQEGGFIQSLRISKLARLLWLHLVAKAKEVKDRVGVIGRRAEKLQSSSSEAGSVVAEDSSGRVTESDRKKADALLEAGWFYRAQGKFDEAKECFRKAIGIDPGNSSAYTGLGRVYLDQGQVREAEDALKRAMGLDPGSFQGYVEMGRLYRSQGKLAEAERSFKRAVELSPKDENAYIELGRLYQHEGRLSEAESCYKNAVEADPKSDRGYEELGWFYQAQGRFPEAVDSFKKILVRDPDNKEAYANLGWICLDQGKVAEAQDFFKRAIELDPGSDQAHVGLGRTYQDQKKLAQAENVFRKAIELDPKNYHAYIELGWISQYQKRSSEAEVYFRKAIEIDPRNDNAYADLSWVYREQGRVPEAEVLLKKGIELCPGSDRLLGALSLICEKEGRPELGRVYAQQAERLRESHNPMTANSFRKLKEILDKRGVKLVCVQYPMRNIASLKRVFGQKSGVIFVDNERVFKEAVKRGSYKEYFADMFAGDFGHCTPKGNELLGRNVAEVILREVFDR